MRIAYLDLSSVSDPSAGYKKKIAAQIRAIETLGVQVISVDIAHSSLISDNDKEKLSGSGIRRTYRRRTRLLEICAGLIESGSIDLVYARYPGGDSVFHRFAVKYGNLIVSEHQSLETQELRTARKGFRLLSEEIYGKKVLRTLSGIVGVTQEICDYEVARSGVPGKPYLVSGNGIDVDSVPVRTPPEYDGKNLDLLCVAQVAKWHGLDRLIKGIAEYRGNVNVRLHIVGDGSEIPNLKSLVADLKLENSVVFHGFKTGTELDELFDKCHIAVGSLGIHRKGLTQTSELKLREYCARGIPFICSSADADFPSDFPFQLKVPADERPIDLNIVSSFADRALSDTDYSVKMREYAKENLDWSIKMKKLIDFMNEILESKVRR